LAALRLHRLNNWRFRRRSRLIDSATAYGRASFFGRRRDRNQPKRTLTFSYDCRSDASSRRRTSARRLSCVWYRVDDSVMGLSGADVRELRAVRAMGLFYPRRCHTPQGLGCDARSFGCPRLRPANCRTRCHGPLSLLLCSLCRCQRWSHLGQMVTRVPFGVTVESRIDRGSYESVFMPCDLVNVGTQITTTSTRSFDGSNFSPSCSSTAVNKLPLKGAEGLRTQWKRTSKNPGSLNTHTVRLKTRIESPATPPMRLPPRLSPALVHSRIRPIQWLGGPV
jgi:hypothetical protein